MYHLSSYSQPILQQGFSTYPMIHCFLLWGNSPKQSVHLLLHQLLSPVLEPLWPSGQKSCPPSVQCWQLVSLRQIIVFMCYGIMLNKWVLQTYQPDFMKSPLVYHPGHRAQVWRFFSYMFMHVGYAPPPRLHTRTLTHSWMQTLSRTRAAVRCHCPLTPSLRRWLVPTQLGAARLQRPAAVDDRRPAGDGPRHLADKSALHGRSARR